MGERYGLSLSESQLSRLIERRFAALSETNRVEFGGGIPVSYTHLDVYKRQEIDAQVARMKLQTLGLKIDALSEAQKQYLSGWEGA